MRRSTLRALSTMKYIVHNNNSKLIKLLVNEVGIDNLYPVGTGMSFPKPNGRPKKKFQMFLKGRPKVEVPFGRRDVPWV